MKPEQTAPTAEGNGRGMHDDGRTLLARNIDDIVTAAGDGRIDAVANEFGMNRTTLYKWRRSGKLLDSIEILWRIADFAGCTVDSLLGRPAPGEDRPATARFDAADAETILAAIGELREAVRALAAATTAKHHGPARESDADSARSLVAHKAGTSIRCGVCCVRVVFPESTPSHQLAAAVDRFRKAHSICLEGGGGS